LRSSSPIVRRRLKPPSGFAASSSALAFRFTPVGIEQQRGTNATVTSSGSSPRVFIGKAVAPRCVEKPDPDNVGYLFRYFEEDVDLGTTPG
jgi:hypothetical protein